MSKLLIIGASDLQLPAIKNAKEHGHEVAVVDFNPNAVGIKFADKYYNVSTIDEEGVYKSAKDFGAQGISTIATDMPMRAIAYASNKLGLSSISYKTAILATDKYEMIKRFEECNVAHPWFFLVEKKEDVYKDDICLRFPCIVKPIDNSGSRGVTVARNFGELEYAVDYSSNCGRSGKVIIEELMTGQEVSVEMLIKNGVAHVIQITDKITTGSPHFVEIGHSQPSSLSSEIKDCIIQLSKKAVKSLEIENGAAHVEIMVTKNGPKMIEMGARLGGDCITSHLVPLSTGIDMINCVNNISLGKDIDISKKYNKGSAIRFITGKKGKIISIKGLENAYNINGVYQIVLTKKNGDFINDVCSSTDRIGYVISQGKNSKDALSICDKVIDSIIVEYEREEK